MIPAPFEYVRPGTIEDALAALADPDAKAIAGGHSLLPMMKLRFARPTLLVDLAPLGLRGVKADGGAIEIGALTTYDELLRDETALPDALREAAAAVGDLQVRNAGTIGGAIAHGDPASDIAAAALALGARLRLHSTNGTRTMAVTDFFLGPYETALAQQELLEAISVPAAVPGDGSGYAWIEDPASGYPLAGAAASVRAGELVIGFTGVGAHPVAVSPVSSDEAGIRESTAALEPLGDSEERRYRRQLAAVVALRAAETAKARAEAPA